MPKNTIQENVFVHYSLTILAWFSFLLVLLVVFMGEDIFPEMAAIYPDYSLPAFFIPWFLLVITSVQKLRGSTSKVPLQSWVLKTTVPIFIFVLPFFSQFLSTSSTVINCIDNCNETLIGFEPYCVYLAITVLFLVHFLPYFNPKHKVVSENKA